MAKKKEKKTTTERIKEAAAIITAITTIGGALIGGCSWIVSQLNTKSDERFDSLTSRLETLERGSVRSQLLALMSSYPDNEEEILRVAEYYFHDLNGDWYMTGLFVEWAEQRGIDIDSIIVVKGDKK